MLDPNEQIIEHIYKRQLQVNRVEGSLLNIMEAKLTKLNNSIASRSMTTNFGIRTETISARLAEFHIESEKEIKATYTELYKAHKAELEELSAKEADNINEAMIAAALIGAGIGYKLSKIKKDLANMRIEGTDVKTWWGRQAIKYRDSVEDSINRSVINKETRKVMKSALKDPLKQSVTAATSLMRTTTQKAVNIARMAVYRSKGNIKGFIQVSVFDGRTSEICIAYGGKMWDLKYKPIGHTLPWNDGPPRHFRCRSTIIPVKDLENPPKGFEFDTWFKKQSAEFQDDALGPIKAKAYRKGEIGLSDLVDQRGRPIKIGDL